MAQRLKCLPAMWENCIRSLGLEDPLEKEMATLSSILAWRISWTEEPGGPQSTGSQTVGHDEQLHYFMFAVTCFIDHRKFEEGCDMLKQKSACVKIS